MFRASLQHLLVKSLLLLLLLPGVFLPLSASAGNPRIIAHRCCNVAENAPENSREALQAALKRPYLYAVEMDVWVTADGVVVVHHDSVMGAFCLETSRYEELKNERLPNGEPLPTLASFLEQLRQTPSIRAVIEIKQHADAANGLRAADAVLRLVREYGVEKQVEYQSFDPAIGQRIIRNCPEALVGYPRGEVTPAELPPRGFRIMDYHYGELFTKPSWIQEARQLGVQANAYTVNSCLDMLHAANLGVDAITTDFPDALRSVLAWRQETPLKPLVTQAPLTSALSALRNTPLAIVYALQDACGKAAGGPEPDSLALAQFCSLWSGGVLLLVLAGVALCSCRRSSSTLPPPQAACGGSPRQGLFSFCSPRGRIAPWAFWWRQLVLTLPLYVCTSCACLAGLGGASSLSVLLTQACPPGFYASALACVGGHYAAEPGVVPWPVGSAPVAPALGIFCLLLSLLAAWCSFALVLRRLRDTRPGLWVLPLCLMLPWWQFIMLTQHRPVWMDDALILLVLLVPMVCLSLPGRRAD